MVEPALLYVAAAVVLFFFWIYGIVAVVRDVKRYILPAYRRWKRGDDQDEPVDGADEPGPPDAP